MSFRTFVPIEYPVDIWWAGYNDAYYRGAERNRDLAQQDRYDCGFAVGMDDRRAIEARLERKAKSA